MQKTTKYTQGAVSVSVSDAGTVAFDSMAYAQKDVADLYALLSNPEILDALGIVVPATESAVLWPDVIYTEEDAALEWPEGSRAVDREGDTHELRDGVWVMVRWAGNAHDRPDDVIYPHQDSFLKDFLPAKVVKVGK